MTLPLRPIAAAILAATLVAVGCNASQAREEEHQAAADSAQKVASTDSAAIALADSARVVGDVKAPIWIIEISDYQCPYCRQWHEETFAQVKREVVDAGLARFAYVHMPLPSHPNAWPAAEAAMCVGLQGKFWEMHDAIFDTQPRWSGQRDPLPIFDSLATSVGADPARMRDCMERDVTRPVIEADAARAAEAGVNSTPTFMVGDIRMEGAYPYAEFRRAVDTALARAKARGR
jgi:protein-disulfide isomerase